MGEAARAKVFWSGRSQAVRLPKAFRLDSTEVRISRRGNALVLEPVEEDWDWLDEVVGEVDEDFRAGILEEQEEQVRPALDRLR